MRILRFSLPAISPFRLDLTVWALKRNGANELEHWDGTTYMRAFILEDTLIKLEVRQKEKGIFVEAMASKNIKNLKAKLTVLLTTMLGLKRDLKPFYRLIKQHKELNELVSKFKGVKPPRFSTLFESIVNAIAFQQLSLEAGFSILNRFIKSYGRPYKEKDLTFYAFPEPKQILKCKPKDLMKLGFSNNKSKTLIHLASELQGNQKRFEHLDQLSNDDLIQFFCGFKGLGRWSAEYILLRGFGRIEVLPGDDVGIRKKIKRLFHLRTIPEYTQIKKIEKKWKPFGGLIYFHVLLQKIHEKGVII